MKNLIKHDKNAMHANYLTVPSIYFICGVLSLIILWVDFVTPLGIASGVPYIIVVLISLKSPEKRFTIAIAWICSLLVGIGYWGSPPSDIALHQVYTNRFLSLLAIWVTAIIALKQRDSMNKLHEEHLKIEQAVREVEIREERLKVLKATAQTVQDIVGNFLNNMQYFRLEIDRKNTLSPESIQKLDQLIQETSLRINKLENVEEVREKKMAGDRIGIDYEQIVKDKDTNEDTISNK